MGQQRLFSDFLLLLIVFILQCSMNETISSIPYIKKRTSFGKTFALLLDKIYRTQSCKISLGLWSLSFYFCFMLQKLLPSSNKHSNVDSNSIWKGCGLFFSRQKRALACNAFWSSDSLFVPVWLPTQGDRWAVSARARCWITDACSWRTSPWVPRSFWAVEGRLNTTVLDYIGKGEPSTVWWKLFGVKRGTLEWTANRR